MARSQYQERYKYEGTIDAFSYNPDTVVLIEDPTHLLYDPRVRRQADPKLVAWILENERVPGEITVYFDKYPLVVNGRQRTRAAREANRIRAEKGLPPVLMRTDKRRFANMQEAAEAIEILNLGFASTVEEQAEKVRLWLSRDYPREKIAEMLGLTVAKVKRLEHWKEKPVEEKRPRKKAMAPRQAKGVAEALRELSHGDDSGDGVAAALMACAFDLIAGDKAAIDGMPARVRQAILAELDKPVARGRSARTVGEARSVLTRLDHRGEAPEEYESPSATSLLHFLRAAWDRGEHTADCDNACMCWLGDIARAGAFGDAAMRHAETQAVEIGDGDLESMVKGALEVLADPVTFDEIVHATAEEAIANGRGMEPSQERVEAMLEMLVGQGVIERAGERDGETLFALVGDGS